VVYRSTVSGIGPVLQHLFERVPAVYEAVIFLTLRTVPIPYVAQQERFLVGGASSAELCWGCPGRRGGGPRAPC
jgi:KUP system potassium uptake protein